MAPYSRMTINQLLTEMDGFKENNVVLIGATNDPQVLDPYFFILQGFNKSGTIWYENRRTDTLLQRSVRNYRILFK